ncbi:MAG TPA: class I tRNA ligase family protein, partial [Nevskiaceae bacterium]
DTLAKVSDDYARRYSFNTAIAACMELSNLLQRWTDTSPQGRAVLQEALDVLVAVLAPIVPHVSHVLWHTLGHAGAVIDAPWPTLDQRAREAQMITVVVQVNGKLRGRLELPAMVGEREAAAAALADPGVARYTEGRVVRKTVYVPGRVLNLVV